MRGKRRKSGTGFLEIVIAALLLGAGNLFNSASGMQVLFYLVLGIGLCYLLLSPSSPWVRARRFRALSMDDVDNMPGLLFEDYVAKLMEHQGYSTQVTPGSGDLGVDIVAKRNGVRYAVQCKRHSGGVSRRAVSDAVAGMNHYECSEAMVVTNSYYTSGALELARSNNCILVDRDELAQWANSFRGTTNNRADKVANVVFAVAGCVILIGLVSGLVSSTRSQSQTATATPASVQGISQARSQIIITIYAEVTSLPPTTAVTATPAPTPTIDAPSVVMALGDTPVNVRSGPSADSASIGILNPGDVVSITGKSSDGLWWQIAYKGQAGWVSISVAPIRGDTSVIKTVSAPADTVIPQTGMTQTPSITPTMASAQ
jgi:restriction system protein